MSARERIVRAASRLGFAVVYQGHHAPCRWALEAWGSVREFDTVRDLARFLNYARLREEMYPRQG